MSRTTPDMKAKVLFFGDSITQAAIEPGGYITRIDSLIRKAGLAGAYELVGAGISGNRVSDLYTRLEPDVLNRYPDVVAIYIGINDVWHKSFGSGTEPGKCEELYRAIVSKLHDRHIKVALCTPTVIGERNEMANGQDDDLDRYAGIVKKIAADYSSPVCDLRKAFIVYLKNNDPENKRQGILTTDGVHLSHEGNVPVASELWKVICSLTK